MLKPQWAFGVTLWEMMTLGQQPYADIDPFEMAAYLQEGYRIAQPHNCPDELWVCSVWTEVLEAVSMEPVVLNSQ